jgi:hypothetical protein
MVRTANKNIQTAHDPDGKILASGLLAQIQEIFRITFQTRKELPVWMPKAAVQTRVPGTPILTTIRTSKAYK